MNGETENLGVWRVASPRRFMLGALLLMASGVVGVTATVFRWAPCGDASDQGQCTTFYELSLLPFGRYFLLWGIADVMLAAALIALLRQAKPRIVGYLIIGCVVAMGLCSVLFGAGVEALRETTVNVLTVGSWVLIPILGLVTILRSVDGRAGDGRGWVVLVMISMVLGSGIAEYILINGIVNYVDTPIGTDGLRYALLALLGTAMLVVLARQRVKVVVGP